VHPTKTEIKFEEDRFIYAILVSSIRQALGKYNIAPTLDFERETSFDVPNAMRNQPVSEPTIKVDTNYNPFKTTTSTSSNPSSGFTKAIHYQGFGNTTSSKEDWENFYSIETVKENDEAQEIEFNDLAENLDQYIYRAPFIITPKKNGLMVIHSKRAYERVVYDSMMTQFVAQPISSQTLLFPFEKEISSREASIWKENTLLLKRLGFAGEIESSTLNIHAVPGILQEENINDCLDLILQTVSFQEIEKGDIAHVLIESVAKNASKSKSLITNRASVQSLIEQLFQCPEHVFTPSGKTILTSITMDEIQHKF
jgi:DNA mismatch repair protein MutL